MTAKDMLSCFSFSHVAVSDRYYSSGNLLFNRKTKHTEIFSWSTLPSKFCAFDILHYPNLLTVQYSICNINHHYLKCF
jgi:hypothetical protein